MDEWAKVWSPDEVKELMLNEMNAYKEDCKVRNREWSRNELIENLYLVLEENHLIELEP